MDKARGLPRILLVEDDPVSRAFLAAALQALPARVDAAESVAAALEAAADRGHDLWLVDAHLPDGSGDDLLARLRMTAQPDTPALAHTASTDPDDHLRLTRAGFRAVLVKPLAASDLQRAVGTVLGLDAGPAALAGAAGELPVWDDDAAANALNGNRAHVDTLRGMFLAELPKARARLLEAARDGHLDRVRDDLHKLRASCGFVGAARLGTVVHALEERLAAAAVGDAAGTGELLARFADAAEETLAASARDGRDAMPAG